MEKFSATSNDHLMQRLPPLLRRNFEELWIDGRVGVSSANITVKFFIKQPSYSECKGTFFNHFLFEIPFASRLLQWEVIFNQENFKFAPDFFFHDETFLADPKVDDLNDVPSLINWDVSNPKALMSVLREFVMLYKRMQFTRLQDDFAFSKLYEEYSSLLNEGNVKDEDIELYIDTNESMTFIISIAVDFSSLPIYMQPDLLPEGRLLNCMEDTATLRLFFLKADSGKVQVHLHLSPRLEQVLGNAKTLHLPQYNRERGLVEYVRLISELLKGRVQDIVLQHKKKAEYITALAVQGLNVVEYDNIQFSKATILCEVDKFFCLVTIGLGYRFPAEKPTVTLRSVYHTFSGKPYQSVLSQYPYSPRWSAVEMFQRLLKELVLAIPKFKMESMLVVRQLR